MFSLLHEFLGRLYRLTIWQGGLNSGSRPMYFGMGGILPWAELLGWVCAPTPLIRWRSGLALWAGAHIVFHPINYQDLKRIKRNKHKN